MISAIPARARAGTAARLPDLLHVTDRWADHVLSGRCAGLVPVGAPPVGEHWHRRLYGDGVLEVWLVSWAPGRAAELHDHGGALGALTVVSGSLDETRWDGAELRERRWNAGDQAGFPRGWVHEIVRAADTAPSALSVHAYSPPPAVPCVAASL